MNEFSRRGFLGLAGAAGIAGLSACAGTGTAPTTGGGGGSSNTIEFWSNHPGQQQAGRAGDHQGLRGGQPGPQGQARRRRQELRGGRAEVQRLPGRRPAARRRRRLGRHVVQLRAQQAAQPRSTSCSRRPRWTRRLRRRALQRLQPRATSTTPCRSRGRRRSSTTTRTSGRPPASRTAGPRTGTSSSRGRRSSRPPPAPTRSSWSCPTARTTSTGYFQNMVWGFGGAYSKEWTPTFSDPNTVKAGTVPPGLRQGRLPQVQQDAGGRLRGRHRRLHRPVDRVARRHHQGGEVLGRDGVPAR